VGRVTALRGGGERSAAPPLVPLAARRLDAGREGAHLTETHGGGRGGELSGRPNRRRRGTGRHCAGVARRNGAEGRPRDARPLPPDDRRQEGGAGRGTGGSRDRPALTSGRRD